MAHVKERHVFAILRQPLDDRAVDGLLLVEPAHAAMEPLVAGLEPPTEELARQVEPPLVAAADVDLDAKAEVG